MPMAPAAAATVGAIGAAAGGTMEAVSAFQGGSGSSVTGMTLPPEYEQQMLDQLQESWKQVNEDYTKAGDIVDAFNTKIDTYAGIVQGTIPETDALKAIADQNARIALVSGQGTEDLIKNGLLTPDEAQQMQELRALESQDFNDPRLEGQLKDERAKLEQELARAGVSPAQRAQALSQFDRQAEESKFTRGEQLRQGKYNRITGSLETSSALRNTNFTMAQAGFQSGQIALGAAQAGANQLSGFAAGQAEAGNRALEFQSGLRGERQAFNESLGKFLLSNTTTRKISSGGIGGVGQYAETVGGDSAAQYLVDKTAGANLTGAERVIGMSNQDLLNEVRRGNELAKNEFDRRTKS